MTLDIKQATVTIGQKNVLDDINMTVRPGEVITVLGPNGAGKSTLMKVASGEHPLSFGEVLLNGRKNWDLRDRQYTTLSGGERQRVHMARVLAQIWDKCPQGDRFLLLDEPTSALDPAHQQLTLKMARQQADEDGMGVLVILHDLNLVARYSDKLVILQQGRLAAQGAPWGVLTPKIVHSVFKIPFFQHL